MKQFVFFWTLLIGSIAFSQNESVVSGFTASEHNGKVLLSWSIREGNTCNGIEIFHSTDSITFYKIGDIEGICGSDNASISYKFTDKTPELNESNYYKLSLGSVGAMWVTKIDLVDLNGGTSLVYPNPITKSGKLTFQNSNKSLVRLSVYSANGREMFIDFTSEEEFEIQTERLTPGVYYYKLSGEGNFRDKSGKFSVRR